MLFDNNDSHTQSVANNRAKALERIRQRQKSIRSTISHNGNSSSLEHNLESNCNKNKAFNGTFQILESSQTPKKPKVNLTTEQLAIIERNRQNALERRKLREGAEIGNLRDASKHITSSGVTSQRACIEEKSNTIEKKLSKYIKPMVKKSDYIEYDFSSIKDTFGGFVSNDVKGSTNSQGEISLEQWKDEQKEKQTYDAPPPLDIINAPKCFDCGSIELDTKYNEKFGCRVCKGCIEKYPEKYSLLTKTECKEDYFLTEPELADESLFKRIVKENPHSGTFSRMQLFLRYQIEEYAFKKWGSEEELDKEWLRREEMRKSRRERRFNKKLKEMRKKLRAEEITRSIRSDRGDKHVHEWSEPVRVGSSENSNLFKRRCIDCGMEVEEILM